MMKELKFDEVLKFDLLLPDMGGSAMDIAMSLDRWNSLPSDIQQIIEGTLPEAQQAHYNAMVRVGKEALEQIRAEGKVKISVATPEEVALWAAKALPTHQKWVDDMAAKGYPAQELYDKVKEVIASYK